jgi:hypothetical protein
MDALKAARVAITTDITVLAAISKWASTVERSGKKIGKKADSLKRKVTRNLLVLDKYLMSEIGEGVVESAQP